MDISETKLLSYHLRTLRIEHLQETISTLEQVIPENKPKWERIFDSQRTDFLGGKLRDISKSAKIHWLKNPFIRRTFKIRVFYNRSFGCSLNEEKGFIHD